MANHFRTRFTLRELILIITVCCLVAALWVSIRPSHPSAFFLAYNPEDEIVATLRSFGHDTLDLQAAGGPEFSRPICRRVTRLSLSTGSLTGEEVFDAFRSRTETMLNRERCTVFREHRLNGMAYVADYICGDRTGRVCAFGFISDGRLLIVVALDESRR